MRDIFRNIKMLLGKVKLYAFLRDRYTDFRVWTYRNLSDRDFIDRDFHHVFGYRYDYNNPKGYHEVISWYKNQPYLAEQSPYVDKFSVREYIEQKIGSQHLVPLIGLWESMDQVDLSILPEKYVLMPTHLSGSYFIQDGTKEIGEKKLLKKLKEWFESNYYQLTREPQYRDIQPRVMVLEYLQDETGDLTDYKYMIIDHKIEFILGIFNRRTKVKYSKVNRDWQLSEEDKKLVANPLFSKLFYKMERPDNYQMMEDIAMKLSEDFPFVRVDLYVVNQQVYFGELTFTSGDNKVKMVPESFNIELGEKIYTALKNHIGGK